MKKEISPVQKMLNTWAIVLIIWAIYRTYFRTELPIWFDEFIAKPAIFLIPVYYFISHVEKTSFFKGIDFKFKGIKQDILLGLGAGVLFMISGLFAFVIKKSEFPNVVPLFSLNVLSIILISFASSISEEILSRGFVLKRLYEDSKSTLSSVFFASFLFFFLHIPILFTNPDLRGMILLQVMLTDILLSVAVSLVYLQRRNIVIPIIIHALYNISIYLFV